MESKILQQGCPNPWDTPRDVPNPWDTPRGFPRFCASLIMNLLDFSPFLCLCILWRTYTACGVRVWCARAACACSVCVQCVRACGVSVRRARAACKIYAVIFWPFRSIFPQQGCPKPWELPRDVPWVWDIPRGVPRLWASLPMDLGHPSAV